MALIHNLYFGMIRTSLYIKLNIFSNMETLLAKFRIEFEEVIIISDIGKKADTSTQMEFDEIIEGMNVSEEELHLEQAKTNR